MSDLDLHGLAAALHRSHDWTQRNWRRLAAREGLPQPFVGAAKGARPWWDAAAIEAWKRGARAGQGPVKAAQPTLQAANDAVSRPTPDDDAGLLGIFR